MPWINDKKQHLYVIRSSASSTVNCKEKLKHVQKAETFPIFLAFFSSLEHTGTPLAAKSKNREDPGSEGREKAVAGIAQESDRAPHVPVPEEQTHVHTHTLLH